MKEYSTDNEENALSTINQNYYTLLFELDDKEMKKMEIEAVRAEQGGGFCHTSEINVMKFKKAMNRPDIKNEHKQMMMNTVWEPLDKNDLPEEASTLACIKKSIGTYHG